jgi:hypothetical protein
MHLQTYKYYIIKWCIYKPMNMISSSDAFLFISFNSWNVIKRKFITSVCSLIFEWNLNFKINMLRLWVVMSGPEPFYWWLLRTPTKSTSSLIVDVFSHLMKNKEAPLLVTLFPLRPEPLVVDISLSLTTLSLSWDLNISRQWWPSPLVGTTYWHKHEVTLACRRWHQLLVNHHCWLP